MGSVVIDTCVMGAYDVPIHPAYVDLFRWIAESGCIVVSKYLLREYMATNNQNLIGLIAFLNKHAEDVRIIEIDKSSIDSYVEDKHFSYTCNGKDKPHARLTFLSPKKRMITGDMALLGDINRFKKVNKIKPMAVEFPDPAFYNGA